MPGRVGRRDLDTAVEEGRRIADWVAWLVIAVILAVAEAFTVTVTLGLLGGAAVMAAASAAVGLPVPVQLVVFAVASAAGLVVLRPVAARHLLRQPWERFGIDALPGRTAYVVDEVTARAGTVRIGGEVWTARALDESAVIPSGAAVDVLQIDGVTAVVYPRE